MPLKSLSMTCVLSASALLGCTHSAPRTPAPPSQQSITLQSHHWQLQQAHTAQGQPETQQWQLAATQHQPARRVGLRFGDDQTLRVDRLCNLVSGNYHAEGTQLQISRMAATMMACSDDALMKLEQSVAQQLPHVRAWKITDGATPLLHLTFANGATWQLQGSPTHETLYGAAERIFLEVAAQTQACNHPLKPDAQCLQVREISYSPQGIKQSAGAWNAYYGAIEGYTHQAGVRNILRIKRFTRTDVPADASRYLDVLDMVVESETVR